MIEAQNIKAVNFISEKYYNEFKAYMNDWAEYSQEVKDSFLVLFNILSIRPDVTFDFNIRTGVSASFKSYVKMNDPPDTRLFSVIDIIDQDPQNIWLSICFYADMISDPDDLGNLIPNGLLDEDGHCFDVFEDDEGLMKYIKSRIDEAYRRVMGI